MHSWSLSSRNKNGIVDCLEGQLYEAFKYFLENSKANGYEILGSNIFDELKNYYPKFIVPTDFAGWSNSPLAKI